MPAYTYTAKDAEGKTFSGTYDDIANLSAIRKDLMRMGYSLVKAQKQKTAQRRKRVGQKDVVEFTFKFSGMYSAGLGVMHCLEVLEEQAENPTLKEILRDVTQKVEAGSSLKKAFEDHERIFGSYFLGMIEAGESGGELSKTLEMTATYLENRLAITQRVKNAFTYPIVVVCVCMVVITALLTFVVPMFSKIYGRMHVDLPGPTQFLVDCSAFIHGYWWAVLAVIIGSLIIIKQLLKNPENCLRLDRFKLRMPVFGKLNRLVVVSRFNRSFSTLLSVGVPIMEALDVAKQVAGNKEMLSVTEELKEVIQAGTPVASALKTHALFPSIIIHMADSGEQAGKLPDMLLKGSDFLDKDIDRIVTSLLVKLEPMLTLSMGSLIGLILMGVYLPMFDYMNKIK
jgi:type IV pilus assembly protein PilC